jgi:hypothetical protein
MEDRGSKGRRMLTGIDESFTFIGGFTAASDGSEAYHSKKRFPRG